MLEASGLRLDKRINLLQSLDTGLSVQSGRTRDAMWRLYCTNEYYTEFPANSMLHSSNSDPRTLLCLTQWYRRVPGGEDHGGLQMRGGLAPPNDSWVSK